MLTITPENKNTITMTNEAKYSGNSITWDQATFTWDEAQGTWDNPALPMHLESKNTVTLTNETKN